MSVWEVLEKGPLLFDGAMGTYLPEKVTDRHVVPCELFNTERPDVIKSIHREYLKAGAKAIKTNTFAANTKSLQMEKDALCDLIVRGFSLAKEAVSPYADAFIFADIGPVPEDEDTDLFAEYQMIVDAFLSCQADCFLFETMESATALEEISAYIKKRVPKAFIAVSFAASPEGYTRAGFLAKNLFYRLQTCETVDAVGFNCVSGPKHLLEFVSSLEKSRIQKVMTVMPNAGYPTVRQERLLYSAKKEYFCRAIEELLEKNVDIVGGCCGTTPEDIAYVRQMMDKKFAHRTKEGQNLPENKQTDRQGYPSAGAVVVRADTDKQEQSVTESYDKKKNSLAKKLMSGKKVIVAELDSPVEPDIEFFMEGAARYRHAGIDAIDIADCPLAKARIDSSILASKVTRELGLPTVPHLTCRDRNINATKALLLGLNIEGVNNVLVVTGDPVPMAMRDQIKTVYSYNSAVLARHIQTFNREIFADNPFFISGALNVNALNFDEQLIHAHRKIENGMSVLFTQPILSKEAFLNLKRAKRELPVKILGGIMPVVSYRNANFMNSEMAGIEVADEIIECFRHKDREEGEELAFVISKHIAKEIYPYVDGYYVITPFRRVNLVLKIAEEIKKLLPS